MDTVGLVYDTKKGRNTETIKHQAMKAKKNRKKSKCERREVKKQKDLKVG